MPITYHIDHFSSTAFTDTDDLRVRTASLLAKRAAGHNGVAVHSLTLNVPYRKAGAVNTRTRIKMMGGRWNGTDWILPMPLTGTAEANERELAWLCQNSYISGVVFSEYTDFMWDGSLKPVWLEVAYTARARAKALGAKWCPTTRAWYMPPGKLTGQVIDTLNAERMVLGYTHPNQPRSQPAPASVQTNTTPAVANGTPAVANGTKTNMTPTSSIFDLDAVRRALASSSSFDEVEDVLLRCNNLHLMQTPSHTRDHRALVSSALGAGAADRVYTLQGASYMVACAPIQDLPLAEGLDIVLVAVEHGGQQNIKAVSNRHELGAIIRHFAAVRVYSVSASVARAAYERLANGFGAKSYDPTKPQVA